MESEVLLTCLMLNANVPFKMKGQQHFQSLWCAIQTHLEIKWSFSVLYLPRVGLVKDLQKNNRTEDVTFSIFPSQHKDNTLFSVVFSRSIYDFILISYGFKLSILYTGKKG